MADNWRAKQIGAVDTMSPGPICCHNLNLSWECRLTSGYGTKCGYVPPYVGDTTPRFFRSVTVTTHTYTHETRTYDTPDACFPDEDPATYEERVAECDYTFTASCADPAGKGNASWSITIGGPLGPYADIGTDVDTPGDYGTSHPLVCRSVADIFGVGILETTFSGQTSFAREPLGIDMFTHLGDITILYDSLNLVHVAALMYMDADCEYWGIEAWDGATLTSLNKTDTGSEDASGDCNYDWNTDASISALLSLCNEYTTAQLTAEVEAAATVGEWATDCCGYRALSYDESYYEYGSIEVRFHYTPPCAGIVRIHYDLNHDGVVTQHHVDNPGSGVAVAIGAPASGTWCIENVRGEMLAL